jgi:hypothetical protein
LLFDNLFGLNEQILGRRTASAESRQQRSQSRFFSKPFGAVGLK